MPVTSKSKLIKLARTDFNAFAEYVGVDDETDEPITQQSDLHRAWDKFLEGYAGDQTFAIKTFPNSGKTTQISILRTAWELGRLPRLRFLIVSNTPTTVRKIVTAIRMSIESARYAEVFPSIKIAKASSSGLTFNHGGVVVGVSALASIPSENSRFDRIVVDDIQNPENAQDAETSKHLFMWYRVMVRSRLSTHAEERIFGTVYHAKDFFSLVGGKQATFPVINNNHTVNRPYVAEDIVRMMKELGSSEFQRQFMCEAPSEATRLAA